MGGRTPHGVRGLKYVGLHVAVRFSQSHPSRGAWIEMVFVRRYDFFHIVAPLTGCVD